MAKYCIGPLLDKLNERPDIFICGPSYRENKLRVYAYGGVLCKLPTTPQAIIELPDQQYFQKDQFLFAALQGLQDQDDEKKDKFLRDHLDNLLPCMKNRFTSKNGEDEERSHQTAISRAHTGFSRHNGTVVCDFQSSIPQALLPNGMSRPTFDMVTFSMDETGDGVFTLVELKCSGKSCEGSSGLEKHARDMLECLHHPPASDFYKKELLRRLDYMLQYNLLQDYPSGLDCPSRWPLEKIKLRAAFLFTSGEGLESRDIAASLCKKNIPESSWNDFLYCFSESPQAVDLSRMERWEAFSAC